MARTTARGRVLYGVSMPERAVRSAGEGQRRRRVLRTRAVVAGGTLRRRRITEHLHRPQSGRWRARSIGKVSKA